MLNPRPAAEIRAERPSATEFSSEAVSTLAKSEFLALVQAAKAGDEAAAQTLVDRYGGHIRRIVERSLAPSLRTKCGPSDIVQAMWASFFLGTLSADRWESSEQLLAFLVTVAKRKVYDAMNRYRTLKRDVDRELRLDVVLSDGKHATRGDAASPALHAGDRPSQTAMARERWEAMTQELDPQQRRILDMKLAGYSVLEIAESLNLNHRHLHRVVNRLLARLEDGD